MGVLVVVIGPSVVVAIVTEASSRREGVVAGPGGAALEAHGAAGGDTRGTHDIRRQRQPPTHCLAAQQPVVDGPRARFFQVCRLPALLLGPLLSSDTVFQYRNELLFLLPYLPHPGLSRPRSDAAPARDALAHSSYFICLGSISGSEQQYVVLGACVWAAGCSGSRWCPWWVLRTDDGLWPVLWHP